MLKLTNAILKIFILLLEVIVMNGLRTLLTIMGRRKQNYFL